MTGIVLHKMSGVEGSLNVTSETLVGEWRTTLDLTEAAQEGIDAEADEMNREQQELISESEKIAKELLK